MNNKVINEIIDFVVELEIIYGYLDIPENRQEALRHINDNYKEEINWAIDFYLQSLTEKEKMERARKIEFFREFKERASISKAE